MSVLIGAADLAALVEKDERVRLLDVRWRLGGPPGRDEYRAAHVPGAVFVDLDAELAGPPSPSRGRHPLPDVSDLQRHVRRWGIDDGDLVVAYDDDGNRAAARAWWLLRWAGLTRVRLLDGGLRAWLAGGHPVQTGQQPPPPAGTAMLTPGHLPTLTADAAARIAREGVLLDARSGERYRGESEPVDPRAGHIPGALSAPTADQLAADLTFLPRQVLAERFAGLGVVAGVPVGVYCGSGVTAAHLAAAMHVAGHGDVALYPGSWSQWSSDPAREVETGSPDGR